MKLGIDVNRHKEILVKAISGLLLLLLKHFKLNHVFQVSNFTSIFGSELGERSERNLLTSLCWGQIFLRIWHH